MTIFNQKIYSRFMELRGEITMKELGKEFNLSQWQASKIVDKGMKEKRAKIKRSL